MEEQDKGYQWVIWRRWVVEVLSEYKEAALRKGQQSYDR